MASPLSTLVFLYYFKRKGPESLGQKFPSEVYLVTLSETHIIDIHMNLNMSAAPLYMCMRCCAHGT